jgi:hypothetical protein
MKKENREGERRGRMKRKNSEEEQRGRTAATEETAE